MINSMTTRTLTGRTKYRTNWLRRLVLQVEVLVVTREVPGLGVFPELEWRDAKVGDFDTSPPGLFKHPPMPYPGQSPATAQFKEPAYEPAP